MGAGKFAEWEREFRGKFAEWGREFRGKYEKLLISNTIFLRILKTYFKDLKNAAKFYILSFLFLRIHEFTIVMIDTHSPY